jgi:hypothetical protein
MSNNRNRMIGGFEDTFERGQSAVAKSVKSTASDFASSTKSQLTGFSSQQPADQGTNEAGSSVQNSDQSQMTDQERVEFLSDLYGKGNGKNNSSNSQKNTQKGAGDITQALGIPQKDPYEGKTPEEIAQIESLRRQLHSDYYQDLLNKSKSNDEPVAEKLEREEEEKNMAALTENKDDLNPAINPQMVKQGTGERVLSTVG